MLEVRETAPNVGIDGYSLDLYLYSLDSCRYSPERSCSVLRRVENIANLVQEGVRVLLKAIRKPLMISMR